jgi:hypothetical protein
MAVAGLAAGSHARRPALNEICEFRKAMPTTPWVGTGFRRPAGYQKHLLEVRRHPPHHRRSACQSHVCMVFGLATSPEAPCGATWPSRHPHQRFSSSPCRCAQSRRVIAQGARWAELTAPGCALCGRKSPPRRTLCGWHRRAPKAHLELRWVHPQQGADQPNPPTDMHPIAHQRRPFRPHFMHLLRLVLPRSRSAEFRKANHFLAHFALLVGPEALSHPATAQKSLGRGGWTPPCAPPRRRCAAPGLGCELRKKCHVRISCVLDWADLRLVGLGYYRRTRRSTKARLG